MSLGKSLNFSEPPFSPLRVAVSSVGVGPWSPDRGGDSERGVKVGESFLWEGALALLWEVVRDEGDEFWDRQTDLNSYPTYKLWDLRERPTLPFTSLVLKLKLHFPYR